MGKLAGKVTKRIMASVLTVAMIMSNMTVYASEYSEPAVQTDEAVENTGTDAVQLPSTNDETVQGEEAQDETANDETSQEGTEGDAQDIDASDENSNPGNDVEGVDISEPEKAGEEVQEPEETDADIQETGDESEAAEVFENADTPATHATTHTIWIVGDSTVCSFNDTTYYYPRYGYGTKIENYLDTTKYTVRNLAASGRSSKSYLKENASDYATLTSSTSGMQAGDVLVIGFGHNDEKNEEARYTNPNGDYQTEGSFANSLYVNYVEKAIKANATVILCTPIVRRSSSNTLSDSNCHITPGATDSAGKSYPGGDYPEAIRQLVTAAGGASKGVYLVDLTELTKTLYESLGASKTLYLHAWTSSKESSVDPTHLNEYGAKKVAWLFANAVKGISGLDLADAINLSAGEPTQENDLKQNPAYVEKGDGYEPPTGSSKLWSDYVIGEGDSAVSFKGSVFGELGSSTEGTAPSKSNFTLETDANGNMHIKAQNNKGKITSSGDGVAMYYYQVPAGKTFEISAKATLTSFGTNDEQLAFGLMARDDMYTDGQKKGITSDFVAAGSLGSKPGTNCFYRKNGGLGGKGTLKNTLEPGKDYDLSIAYNGEGFACTFGDEDPQSAGYDFQLTGVDSKYVYIGMFATRNVDITFSNIYLKVGNDVLVDERKDAHEITVTSDGHGTAKANNATASEGSTVVLSAMPNDGYMFKEWQITSNGTETTRVDNQYTMPANDVEIKAVFEKLATEWNFQTDTSLTGPTNGINREGKGKNTTFYAKGLLVDATKGKWDSTGTNGGVEISKDTTIIIPVKKCDYAKVEVIAETKDYTLDYVNEATKAGEVEEFVCEASSREILLEITADNKIQYIKVTPDATYTPPTPKANIQVWDFGGKVETDTDLYTNNITPGLIRKLGIVAEGGSYKGTGPTSFGDLDMNYSSGDRLYTNIPSLSAYNAGPYTNAQRTYSDGYASAGAWYGNGNGSATTKTVTINKVKAGDKIVAYMGSHQIAGCEFTFAYTGDDSDTSKKQSVTVSVAAAGDFDKFEFIAEYDGSYKIYQSGGTGKIMYHRIMKLPVVTVSGTIDDSATTEKLPSEYSVRFYNETTKAYTDAEVNTTNKTFTAKLTPGYTYRAVLNATGLGFTNESKTVTVKESDCKTGTIDDVTLVVKKASTYTYSGEIEGFAADYDLSDLNMTMVPDESFPDASEEPLEVDKTNLTFSAPLEPDVTYTIQMEGVCDYEVTAPASVNSDGNGDYTHETITVALKATYDVTGNFIGLGDSANVTKLTFTNIDDHYPYNATVNGDGDGYSVKLRNGTYLASAEVTGYSTKTHVVVNGTAVTRDIMFISTGTKPTVDYVEDIYVGYPDNANNYETVSEAVEACALMTRTATQRVTVHIAPGTYREQIIVTAPNVSFVNDTNKEVLLTWYYGIGYKYYSADSSGFYNPENAYDQFEKNKAKKWGVAVYIKSTATAFRAEGITFENSFNRYVTDEELEDGVELLNNPDDSKITVVRNYNTDVDSKTATERATAIAIEADQAEFLNCGFYSSQDTLYTQGAHSYFKNCIIEGQTDYIFGSGNCVFDACELSWKGYSANSQGGYITANRPESSGEKGYLFRNCTVTGENKLSVANDKKNPLTVESGYFGRPWGATASVAFMNTKLQNGDLITTAGWDEMGSGDKTNLPQNANFKEYNTTTVAGTPVSTSGRTNPVMDATAAAAIKVADYFGSWTPSYYVAEDTSLEFAKDPFITSNGDLNTPYPGNTLTVGYSLGDKNDSNDVSLIQWYSVKGDKETLVKTSNATLDKKYKIQSTDEGTYIKVVVTPTMVSGTVGAPKDCTLDNVVREGYEDPDHSGGDVNLGDGVNIFLIGDSTVKDYSASGINSGGSARNEGAWGEFLQTYFDSSKVTIVNYANGGRSSRNFINEGSLDKVAKKIGKGDYMFIQFGHNDSSNGASYLADRFVPLGTPVNGIYPSTAGTKVTTPTELSSNGYGDTCYTYDCGGTFKWYLQQYIDVAKAAEAIPVLVTPVSRMYYDSAGAIREHHDSTDTTTNTQTTSGNAYVEAVKQLAKEQDVLLIDGFELTKKLFEDAWQEGGNDTYGTQIMHTNDKTHNNKLGGMIEAAAIASAIQDLGINISSAVKAPAQVLGMTTDAKTVFTVNNSNILTAFDINSDYAEHAAYWENIGQTMINAIKEKAAELNPGNTEDPNNTGNKSVGLKIILNKNEYTYTGSAIIPKFTVTNNGNELTEGVDYTVKYSNNKNANASKTKESQKAKITITGKGSFSGKSVAYFTINPKSLKDNDIKVGSITVLKNAKAAPILFYNGVKLAAKDFTIKEPANAKFTASGNLKVEGKGNFTDIIDIPVKVVDKLQKITSVVMKPGVSYVYDGSRKEPQYTVKSGSANVENSAGVEDKYIIVYNRDNIVDAGTVKFTIIGIGEYTGSVTKSYKIAPNKSASITAALTKTSYEYGVTIPDKDITVTADGKTLKKDVDYKVTYSGNKKVTKGNAKAKANITFIGNYKGCPKKSLEFSVTPATISKDTVKVFAADKIFKKENVYKSVPSVIYKGADGVETLLKKSDYTVKYYLVEACTDNQEMTSKNKVKAAGTDVYVKVTGKGNYASSDPTVYAVGKYKVRELGRMKDLSKAKIEIWDKAANKKTTKVEYTGKEIKLDGTKYELKVYFGTAKKPEPVAVSEYNVSYANNINKGKATIIITAKDTSVNYLGSKTGTFSIVAQKVPATFGTGTKTGDAAANALNMFKFAFN